MVSRASTSAPAPVPLAMARSMLSLGIEASLAFCTARAREGLPSGSPPPSFAATVIARASLVKSLPRRASTIAFLCLIPAHLECPAIRGSVYAALEPERARMAVAAEARHEPLDQFRLRAHDGVDAEQDAPVRVAREEGLDEVLLGPVPAHLEPDAVDLPGQ